MRHIKVFRKTPTRDQKVSHLHIPSFHQFFCLKSLDLAKDVDICLTQNGIAVVK